MAYRVHNVTIHQEDREKAEAIISKYELCGCIDNCRVEERFSHDGKYTVAYWVNPIIYEDFEAMVKEFRQKGIRVKDLDH